MITPPSPANLGILLIDGDRSLQSRIKEYFLDHGMIVTTASSREEASVLLAGSTYDLVILDFGHGADNGVEILRELRAKSNVPVIITTTHRRDTTERVVGLELGADDCVAKPFGLRELLARVRVVMRRAATRPEAAAPSASSETRRFEGWVLDRRHRHLTNPLGETVDLTRSEYALLVAFLDAPQCPLSREYLLQATRVHEDVYDRSIDVQILRLRRKLEADPRDPRMIVTERGVGYVFAARVETLSKAPRATRRRSPVEC